MMSLISTLKAQQKLRDSTRARRLLLGLTQAGLSERSGVPLPTLRKFEQKGIISLESFIKILVVVGGLEEIISALKPSIPKFNSIDEVLTKDIKLSRKRGRKK